MSDWTYLNTKTPQARLKEISRSLESLKASIHSSLRAYKRESVQYLKERLAEIDRLYTPEGPYPLARKDYAIDCAKTHAQWARGVQAKHISQNIQDINTLRGIRDTTLAQIAGLEKRKADTQEALELVRGILTPYQMELLGLGK